MSVLSVIQKHVPEGLDFEPIAYSCKISEFHRLKIIYLSKHLGVKRTKLAGELLEAAIDEAFEEVYDVLHDIIKSEYTEEEENLREHLLNERR